MDVESHRSDCVFSHYFTIYNMKCNSKQYMVSEPGTETDTSTTVGQNWMEKRESDGKKKCCCKLFVLACIPVF